MMVERVLSLEGGYVAPWSHCASWSCQRTHHHYIGRIYYLTLSFNHVMEMGRRAERLLIQ